MPLTQRCQTSLPKFLSTLACVLFISSGHARFQPNQVKPNTSPPRVELCYVLRNSEFYDGKHVTLRATFRIGRKQSQLYCMACIDGGRVWMRELLPAGGEVSAGIKELNDLIQENGKGVTVNGVFTGLFRGPGQYGRLGAFTYQLEVQEVREIELVFPTGPEPEDLSAEMKKKVCQ
jgi:hypothetical protein